MTSVIRGDDNFDSSEAVSGTAKAWVNFDGTTNTGGNCDIRASYNVSTVGDNGIGDYTVNFTTALADANYAFSGFISNTADWSAEIAGSARGTSGIHQQGTTQPTSSSIRVETRYGALSGGNGANADFGAVSVSIFR